MRYLIGLSLAILFACHEGFAQGTRTWNGNNNNWRNNDNWSGGNTPGALDTGIFPRGESRTVIDLRTSSGNPSDRTIDTAEFKTDGLETTDEPGGAVDWYLKQGTLRMKTLEWDSSATNGNIRLFV
ncbi:MAG: hypothetical protein AAF492_29250, partial [Verrucomicrobiota bacterium]